MLRTLFVLCLCLVPSFGSAATITFERPFSFVNDLHFPAQDDSFEPGYVDRYYLVTDGMGWDIPVFNPTLGTLEALFLDITGAITITGTLEPTTDVQTAIVINNPFTGQLDGPGPPLQCEAPCIATIPVALHWESGFTQSQFPFTFVVHVNSAESWLQYAIASDGTFHFDFTGTASATYLYTAAPEPSSLALLSAGLLAARRRTRVSRTPQIQSNGLPLTPKSLRSSGP